MSETTESIHGAQQKMLDEIQKAVPSAEWTTEIPDKQFGLVLTLPHDCLISATLSYDVQKKGHVYIDMFQVPESMQKNGIGTRLLKALTVETKKYGAQTLFGHVTSESALQTRAAVFGEANLRFYNMHTAQGPTPLDITYDQVIKTSKSEGKIDYGVEVDLTKIDLSSWEKSERKM